MVNYKWGDRSIENKCSCGKKFISFKSANKKYCSLKCSGIYKIKVSYWKGKKMSENMRKNLSKAQEKSWKDGKRYLSKKCLNCGSFKSKTHDCKEIAKKISISNSGNRHWNWQGGITSSGYPVGWNIHLKKTIRKRDNWQCQKCGTKNKKLNVHHIDHNKKNLSLNNLITWCTSCHMKHHNGQRKR